MAIAASRTLVGGGKDKVLVLLRTLSGADETNTIIYNNSTFVNDVTKGNLMEYYISGSDCLVNLIWDQTTPSPIVSVNPINSPKGNFKHFGGIHNPKGAGSTGNMLITTTGLGAGEAITVILVIHQN